MEKDTEITAEIVSQGSRGEGVAKPEGFPVFVEGAVAGDLCRIRITKLHKSYGEGQLLEIVKPSEDRVQPPCPAFALCGGCALMHMSYAAQLRWKRMRLRDSLVRIGGCRDIFVAETESDGRCFAYRNKIQIPVIETENGIQAGFYAAKSHTPVPCKACLLQSEGCRQAIEAVTAWMTKKQISPYIPASHSGDVRHIYVRESGNGERMLSLVTQAEALPHKDALIKCLRQAGVTTLLQNINPDRTHAVLGNETKTLYGSGTVTETLCGLHFTVSHDSFFQVNTPMAARLYQKGLSLLGDISDKTVWDLYCGIGTISLFLAQYAKRVIGIEIVPAAIEDAKKNAEKNRFSNAEFYRGDAFKITKMLQEKGMPPDICVVDPPRRGCDGALLETLMHLRPAQILYISCDPATLARDVKYLTAGGYACTEAYPFDLFPQTAHVETVLRMIRK